MRKLFSTIIFICIAASLLSQGGRGGNKDYEQRLSQEKHEQGKGHGKQDKPNRGSGDNPKERMQIFPLESLYGNVVLGCPTNNSIVINVIAAKGDKVWAEYSTESGKYRYQSQTYTSSGDPQEIELTNLEKDTRYLYRMHYGNNTSPEYSFTTNRNRGETFVFGVQGDSHPERTGKMFNSELYRANMRNVSSVRPDFYFTSGDDFSIDHLIERGQASKQSVEQIYLNHRAYFGIISSNAPLFLVNGNHEQAAKYLLDGTPNSPAILAANARNKYYSLPTPEGFYSGNKDKVEYVGYLHDYYGFEWGDALFLVIDPYWHSDSAVDNVAGGGEKRKDMWGITLGNEQYRWFKETLEKSKAKYKFVFTHHVLGTGRGGIECADLYEWGGKNSRGEWEFSKQRPGWEMPIHQLMAKNGVTIFFQGHDHLFAKQELDGVVYKSLPNPADDTYTAFNADAYKGVVLPNSGFLKVTVSPQGVDVKYILALLPKDETPMLHNGDVAYSYIIKDRK